MNRAHDDIISSFFIVPVQISRLVNFFSCYYQMSDICCKIELFRIIRYEQTKNYKLESKRRKRKRTNVSTSIRIIIANFYRRSISIANLYEFLNVTKILLSKPQTTFMFIFYPFSVFVDYKV